MAKKFQIIRFRTEEGTGYFSDRGTEHDANGRFVIPPDISDSEAAQIAALAGGQTTGDPVPCPDTQDFAPRKLVFIRQSGNSLSVPVSQRNQLAVAGNDIAAVLNKPNNKVVCVKLAGEKWDNLNDELGLDFQGTAPDSRPNNGRIQYVYSGIIEYQSDTGVSVTIPVKTLSDRENQPPSNVASVWGNCVGDFLTNNFSCGASTRRDHRRYLIDFRVAADTAERKEVPVRESAAGEIFNCGQAIANLTGVFCIGYMGESYDRFHKVMSLP